MRTLGNILWHFPLFGFVQAALTWLLGLILTITVIAAPIGRGLMEYGKFLFAPFSKAMVRRSALNEKQNPVWKAYSVIITVLYLPFGLILAVVAILQIAALICTIAGIPMAIVLAKSLGTFFNPVNKKCVPRAVAIELERRASAGAVERHLASEQAGE
ncbi:MAG: hypothetical protein HKN20_05290 [Gemmatimonadetes bacterium]|nr:hypothetical protein [Gemmatimonadota bacterium]